MKLLNLEEVNHPGVSWLEAEPKVSKFKLKGKHILYDENSMMLWEVPEKFYNRQDLNRIGVRQKPYFTQDFKQPNWRMLVFQSTYACNLDCHYCFVTHHYADHTNKLKLKVVQDALAAYQPASSGRNLNFGFFGGEPLMNWDVIYQSIEHAKKVADREKRSLQVHITTNATLVTPEIADYLAENNVSFIVSIDGTEEFHNNNRPYHLGEGTYKDVLRGLEYLANAYHKKHPQKEVPITLRGTFDNSGVDLTECVKHLNQLMYDGYGSHVSVEPSSLGESCSTDATSFEAFEVAEIRSLFESEYWRVADWFLSEIRAGRKPSFHHFEMPIQRIFDRMPAAAECGAGKGYLSIGPGGTIAACHREHGAYIGDLYKGGIQPDLAAKWQDNRLYNRTTCPDCWRKNLCGGGCRTNSALITGNIFQPSVVECLFKEMETLPTFWLLSEMTFEEKQMYSRQPRRPAVLGLNVAPQQYPDMVNKEEIYDPTRQVQLWSMQLKAPGNSGPTQNGGPSSSANFGMTPTSSFVPQVTQKLQIASASGSEPQETSLPDWVKNAVPRANQTPPSEDEFIEELERKHKEESTKEYEFKSDEKIDQNREKQKSWTNPKPAADPYSNRKQSSDLDGQEEVVFGDEEKEGCCKSEEECGCSTSQDDSYGNGGKIDRLKSEELEVDF